MRSFSGRLLAAGLLGLVALAALALSARAADTRFTDVVSVGAVNGNGNFDATFGGISADGSHAFFTSTEQLSPSDTDAKYDVYERSGTTTTLVSAGAINGNGAFDASFAGTSQDGLHVYFQTAEKLVSADTDSVVDVYERSGGVTTLLSTGTGNFNTANASFYLGVSSDASKVFISSYDQLAATDTDGSFRDVYVRSGGATTQISTGGNGSFGADFDGMTPDGSHVYFHTDERLAGTDTDSVRDVYDASGGTVTQVSRGSTGGNGTQIPIWQASSTDGAHVYFQTAESLEPTDTDSNLDVYDRSGGATTQISVGPNGGNGPWDAAFSGASADGSQVWFITREALVSGDTDAGCEDLNGNPTLPCLDVYERSGGATTLISTGPASINGSFEAAFGSVSQDGTKVFFMTDETMTADDADGGFGDVFERSGGTTTLISTGPNGGSGPHSASIAGISKDGQRVYFHTFESLSSQDNDGNWQDVYQRYGGETTLISTGPAASNQASISFLDALTGDGTKAFFHTDEKLVSGDTDAAEDIYISTPVIVGAYPRPKGATPATFGLVPAYSPCASPNSNHGAPLAFGSCKPPTQDSGTLTIGTPDANGHAASANSQVKFRVVGGASPNVEVVTRITDVLCMNANAACPGGALSDFAGKLLIRATLRITDKVNGSPAVEPATGQSYDLEVPIQCVATPASSTTGGSCTGTVTVNSLFPGAITTGQRMVWQFEAMKVLDPGPNGTGFGAGCPTTCGDGDETVFLRPGVFVP